MNAPPRWFLCWAVLGAALLTESHAGEPIKPLAGTNLALGNKAAYSPEPNYRYCRGGVGTPEHEAVFKEWVRQIRDHMHQKGFSTDQWAFYWVDEPSDASFLKYVVPASRLAKAVDPSILVWEDHQVSLKMLERHPDAIDVHCCPTSYYRAHPDVLKHVLAEKHPSAHYVCASSKAGDREHTSYGMVYATPDGPMTGKRREAWREGVEDVELWRHLRNAARESGHEQLERLLKAFDREHNATPEALLNTRREILEALAARASTQ